MRLDPCSSRDNSLVTPLSFSEPERSEVMSDMPEISDAKRVLLEKYLRGELPQTSKALSASVVTQVGTAAEAGSGVRVSSVRTSGASTPFFFLHGQWEEGMSFHCYPLAQALGTDQPFYGLEPFPLDGRRTLPSLQDMATANLKAMRAIQPEGPYLLGGWCNGGLIAYEMARQLQIEGQVLDLLVLMDPEFLVYPISFRWYRSSFNQLGKLLRINQVKQLDWYLRLKHLFRLVRTRLLRRNDPDGHLSFASLNQDYARLFDWIAAKYAPSSLYRGKITFFWTIGDNEERASRKSWRKVEANSNVELHLIPGDHITSRTVFLPVLADHLKDCVRKAQAIATT